MGLWLYLIDAKRAVLGGALSEGGNRKDGAEDYRQRGVRCWAQ